MSDFNHLHLYATFSGFRVMVLANRLGCENDLSRATHDRLVSHLETLINQMHRAMAAERDLALNPDADRDDLGELIWAIDQTFIDMLQECDGIDLIENDIVVDWTTKEWFDLRTETWHFIDAFQPPRVAIGDDRLNGLCAIIAQIAAETGLRFTTYANQSDHPEELGDYDGIEDPARNPLWGPDTD